MRFEVLGRLRAVAPVAAAGGAPVDGAGRAGGPGAAGELPLGGPKQRLVLALLLTEANATVSVDRLILGVWGESPPSSARHTLQSYVSELRKALGEVIERDGTGYAVRVDRDRLDALEFESRTSEARARLDRDPSGAVAELTAALGLWRGRPFEDFPDQPELQAHATRLDDLRLVAVEAALTGRLALGDHVAVALELERLTRDHPYREDLRGLQMLALYRSGRQADALRAFQATRAVLGEELGIVPSPRLRRLEEQILLQDPGLDLAASAAAVATGPATGAENPYMGLRTFREEDADRFYGHEPLVDQLTRRVTGDGTFTAVVGPSGAGKSSAVRAGLVPRLRAGAPHVRIAVLQPGSQPFAELEAALGRVAGDARVASLGELRAGDAGLLETAIRLLGPQPDRLLLVVDQFEELFVLVEQDEADRFIAALVRAAGDPRRRIHVLVTMRADFYDRPLAAPALGPLFAENVVTVVPLRPDELDAAATLPARQVDVTVEPRLVERLIADVVGQPNALPLFQYALTELFDERAGSVLDLATYERIGGVRRAVAHRAESLYDALDGPEQEAARQLFFRIATVSGVAIGRRRVPASELAALDVDIVALQAVIEVFARHRLLALDRDPTTGGPTVEVAHEALLAEWHRVRAWIDESREDLATQARFAVAVNEWEVSGRDPGYLLSGTRLDHYERWAATSRLKLTGTERAFIGEAVEAREREHVQHGARAAAAARQRRRTRGQLAAALVAVLLLGGALAYPALTPDREPLRVATFLTGPRADQVFEELLARAVESGAATHGMEAVVREPPYTDLVGTLGEVGADAELVFATQVMAGEMATAAAGHPDTTWVFLDLPHPPGIPNGVAAGIANEQGAFLVGAAAALESTTGRIGYIGANASPFLIEEFRAGFEQGARAARPDVEIVEALVDPSDTSGAWGYLDPARAHELARWMYVDEEVDVIFTAAGQSGRGVVEAATELSEQVGRHLWAIGVDTDLLFELPADQRAHLLTSMLKRLDVVVERVIAAHQDGSLARPGVVRLGLAEDAVGYSMAGQHLAPDTIAAVDRLAVAVASGEITVDRTPIGDVREPPAAPLAADTAASRSALVVGERFIGALGEGDVAGAFDLVAPDAAATYHGPLTVAQLEYLFTMEVAAGGGYVGADCDVHDAQGLLRVDCEYAGLDGVGRVVGAPPVSETARITVEDGVVTALERLVGTPDYFAVDEAFDDWMLAHHPDALADVGWEPRDVEDARRRGELRAAFAVEWAEYLEALGCSFDAGC